jgi:hypothetical protein
MADGSLSQVECAYLLDIIKKRIEANYEPN